MNPTTLESNPNPITEPTYYSAGFNYPAAARGTGVPGVIHLSFAVDEREESKKLSAAIRVVDSAMERLGLEWRHEYAWPNGSLYNYIRSDLSYADLYYVLRLSVPYPIELHVVSEDFDPYKHNCETIRDYFNQEPSNELQP